MPRCSASVDISTTPTTSSLEPKSPWSQMASQGFASGFLQACKVCDDSSLSSAITAPRGIQRLLTHIRWCSLQRPSYHSASRAWKTMRPMRPNPLMPIFTAIAISTMGQEFGDALARTEHYNSTCTNCDKSCIGE